MDLLAALNIDELPEQQTRTLHIMEAHPELDVKLGFDACCACGTRLSDSMKMRVTCSQCERVDYCSEKCRHEDSQALTSSVASASKKSASEEHGDEFPPAEETAMGHSSIICALLKLCQDDDDVESDDAAVAQFEHKRREAAQDRIQSELESYPATLVNAIAEGPCYQKKLWTGICKDTNALIVHVIGASVEAELWGSSAKHKTDLTQDNILETAIPYYTEAFAELAEKKALTQIDLFMFGPECPSPKNLQTSRSISRMDGSELGQLTIRTYNGSYGSRLLKQHDVPKANVVVFFNPGFTVPDYTWKESLACIPTGTPFLSTTNTEMEGIADCQFLLDQDRIQSIPPGLAEMFGLYSHADDGDDDAMALRETSFFTINPFCGSRIRQSGTMGNDLFVKNRWMLGGIMDTFDPSIAQQSSVGSKKRRTAEEGGNSKASNPALI